MHVQIWLANAVSRHHMKAWFSFLVGGPCVDLLKHPALHQYTFFFLFEQRFTSHSKHG